MPPGWDRNVYISSTNSGSDFLHLLTPLRQMGGVGLTFYGFVNPPRRCPGAAGFPAWAGGERAAISGDQGPACRGKKEAAP